MSQQPKQPRPGQRTGVTPLARDRQISGQRVTLDDTALTTKTSTAIVLRALGGSPRVAAPTRERIERVTEQLGCQVNIAASLLASARPQILDLVCFPNQELHVRCRAETLRYAKDRGFRVTVESIDTSRDVNRAWGSVLQLYTQAVIAVDSTRTSTRFPNTPTVLIDQCVPHRDTDLMTNPNGRGMGQAIALLTQRGSRCTTFFEGPPGPPVRTRKAVFTRAYITHEVSAFTVPGGDNVDAGLLAIRAGLLAGVNTLVCYNGQYTHGAILVLLRDGLVPERDILVAGCDSSAVASSHVLSLTSIDHVPSRVASLAADQTIARALSDGGSPVRQYVETELVVRVSTGQPRGTNCP